MGPESELPHDLRVKLYQALGLLDDLSVEDQLEVTCLLVGAVLQAARPRFKGYPESRAAYNQLCSLAGSWVEVEIAPLRFSRIALSSRDERG